MFEVEQTLADHKDVIHDVEYDYYGKRMATCSSDHTVKVWDEDDQGRLSVSNSWKAHSGSVWRLSWAHPEYGQVLASCSFDRTASIWEEIVGEKVIATGMPSKRWVRRATLSDSRTGIIAVEFAPKYMGLMLATASADGNIRIYSAPDIMNLSQWPLQHEVNNKLPLSCLSWNPSKYMLPYQLLVAGSDETGTSTGKALVYAFSETSRKYVKLDAINDITEPVHDIAFSPNVGRSFHVVAVASKDLYIVNLKVVPDNSTGSTNSKLETHVMKFSEHNCPVWRVCWNMMATILASTGDDGCVRIWRMHGPKIWNCEAVLKAEGSSPTLEPSMQQSALSNGSGVTTKYYKKGIISNPNQVPLH